MLPVFFNISHQTAGRALSAERGPWQIIGKTLYQGRLIICVLCMYVLYLLRTVPWSQALELFIDISYTVIQIKHLRWKKSKGTTQRRGIHSAEQLQYTHMPVQSVQYAGLFCKGKYCRIRLFGIWSQFDVFLLWLVKVVTVLATMSGQKVW